jgi:hypothetical protein
LGFNDLLSAFIAQNERNVGSWEKAKLLLGLNPLHFVTDESKHRCASGHQQREEKGLAVSYANPSSQGGANSSRKSAACPITLGGFVKGVKLVRHFNPREGKECFPEAVSGYHPQRLFRHDSELFSIFLRLGFNLS